MNTIHQLTFVTLLWVLGCLSVPAQEKLTLEQCKELALKNNKAFQNSTLDIKASRETRREAFTKYFPNISGFGTWYNANRPMAEMMTAQGPVGMLEKGVMWGATAMQPIFAGGQIVNGNKLAKIGEEVSELKQLMTENELMLSVESYFWQIAGLEEKLNTLAEAETLLKQAHTDANNAFQAGLVNRNDVLKVELKQNEMEANRLKVTNGLKITHMILAQLVGVAPGALITDTTLPALLPSPADVRTNHESAVTLRPEYRLLNKNIEAVRTQLRMSVGENLPKIGVGVGYNYFNFDYSKPTQMKNDFGMVFASVSVPLSGWWGGAHTIRKQKINVVMAQNSKRDSEEKLLIEMQQTWNELEEAFQQRALAEKSIDTALENVRLNSDYYKAGTGLLLDLLDAQTTLQQCRDQLTEATATYRIKLCKYRQVTEQQ